MARAYVLGLWTLVLLASPAAAQSKRPRLDLYGDALPEDALLRIGSLRLQAGGRIGDLTFSRDGKHIVAATRTLGVYVWDVATGKELHHLPRITPTPFDNEPRPTDKFVGRVLAPGGRYVAEVDRKSVLTLKEVATGREIITDRSELFQVDARRIQFAPNGKTLAVMRFGVTNDGSIPISLYEVASGKLLQSQAVARLSPGGTHVAEVSKQGLVRLRTVASGREVQFDRKPWEVARAVAFAPNDSTLAIMDAATSTVHLYAVASGKLLESQRFAFAHDNRSVVIGIGPDGRTVTLASPGAGVHLYYANTRKRFVREGNSKASAFSPDGKLLATSSGHVIEVATGKSVPINVEGQALRTISQDTQVAVRYLPMISPDGRLLAEPPVDAGPVQLRELATGQVVGDFADRVHVISRNLTYLFNNDRLAFAPSGRLLAAATTAGAILVWNLATSEVVAELKGHRGGVTSLSWSPDGKRLVSSGQDMTLLVWDAAAWWARVEKAAHSLPPAALQTLWRDLASDRAEQGYKAVWQLVRAPKQALALLHQQLPGAGSTAAAKVRALLADLDSAKFGVREKADAELEKLGDLAVPGLEKAQAASLEVRKRAEKLLPQLDQRPLPTGVLLQLRALKVLETIGAAEAKAFLQELAGEDVFGWLTREARLALARCR